MHNISGIENTFSRVHLDKHRSSKTDWILISQPNPNKIIINWENSSDHAILTSIIDIAQKLPNQNIIKIVDKKISSILCEVGSINVLNGIEWIKKVNNGVKRGDHIRKIRIKLI